MSHSAGPWLSASYNEDGFIDTITDSLARFRTYEYDETGEHLLSVRDEHGRITRYTYDESLNPAHEHALLSVEHPDGSYNYFEYDSAGRLSARFLDDGVERIELHYEVPGKVTHVDADDNSTQLFYDHQGSVVKRIAACCPGPCTILMMRDVWYK